ncbi:MAG: M23 family metallopeptidase [Chloroflexi bacterium]|nr:M23 family metallopeptidase [Chloroflexota bacterium]
MASLNGDILLLYHTLVYTTLEKREILIRIRRGDPLNGYQVFTYWPIVDFEHGLIRTDDPQVILDVGIDFLLRRIESDFGFRNIGETGTLYHDGIDIPASPNTPIVAVADGIVEQVYFDPKHYLHSIIIYHPHLRIYTKYVHLGSLDTILGKIHKSWPDDSIVLAGEIIGHTGQYNHLHFSVMTSLYGGNDKMSFRDNPLVYYPHLNDLTPTIKGPSIKLPTTDGFFTPSTDAVIPIHNSAWISVTVSTFDKDVEVVEVWLDADYQDAEILRVFDYYMGYSKENHSLNFVKPEEIDERTRFPQSAAQLSENSNFAASLVTCPYNTPSQNSPSADSFLFFLRTWDLPFDNQVHTLTVRVKDVAGHYADVTLQVKREQ